jgi:hypothetical protein
MESRFRSACLVLAGALIACVSVSGQTFADEGQKRIDFFSVAAIVSCVVPDGKPLTDLTIALTGQGEAEFRAWRGLEGTPATRADYPLRGGARYDERGLDTAWLGGAVVFSRQLRTLTGYLTSRPEIWTESVALAALMEGHPRFPPSQGAELNAWVRRVNWERVFGRVKLARPVFVYRDPSDTLVISGSGSPRVEMVWEVVATRSGGVRYTLTFEPYGGNLIAIRREK